MMKGATERPLSYSSKEGLATASACLAGIPCRYDGSSRPSKEILEEAKKGRIHLACPECLGGLKNPRPPAEIQGGDGFDVLDGKARVRDSEDRDLTDALVQGANRFLETVQKNGSKRVYLKSKSPSCALHHIYDGTFTGTMRTGCGVTAALLQRAGIEVIEI